MVDPGSLCSRSPISAAQFFLDAQLALLEVLDFASSGKGRLISSLDAAFEAGVLELQCADMRTVP
jgi:hypothetical protein